MTTSPDHDAGLEWTIGDRLRKARERAKLDQAQMAERIGVGRSTISNYETGTTPAKKPILLSWAFATGVPLEWLERGENPHPGGPDGGSGVTKPVTGQQPRPYQQCLEAVA